ncbi:hypothetical protein [Streptomyces sp. NPDC007905]|uniref:ATP-binding protein n=1 Tax=Streptomyces sp. NPDC007905 TaxID=3364788 RepID=UPI0036E0D7F8
MPEHLVTASHIAGQMGLPSASAASLSVLGDLATLRTLLAYHSVPQPRWAEAFDAAAAVTEAETIGYPVLVRPRASKEAGAVLAHNRAEVLDACKRLTEVSTSSTFRRVGDVVVEECLDGLPFSAETVVLGDGEIRIVAIARTTIGSMSMRQAMRHCVYAHDGLLHNPIVRQIVTRAVRAVGIAPGTLHVSMKLTPRGPRITDIEGCLANDFIPLLVRRATGIDLPRIAAQLAVGKTPDLAPTRQRAAAIHFAYPSASGRIEHLTVSPKIADQPLLDRIVPLQQTGNKVLATPESRLSDRLAYWVALGSDVPHCHTILDEMTKYLSVDIAGSTIGSHAA